MRLSREILKSYYEHVPLVINYGYVQDSRGLATCEPPTDNYRKAIGLRG